MSFIIKLFLYLFISTSVLVFSYDVVKYARDSMRISNMNTLYRVILYYQGMEEATPPSRSEEHTSELQSLVNLVCRLLLEKKKTKT